MRRTSREFLVAAVIAGAALAPSAATAQEVDFAAPVSGPTEGQTRVVLAHDLDGDGLADVVAGYCSTAFCATDAAVFRGSGLDRLALTSLAAGSAASWTPNAGCLADADGDGRLDVIFVVQRGLSVFLADGPARFAPARFVAHALSPAPNHVFAANLDGVAPTDLVAFGQYSGYPGSLSTLVADGTGGYAVTETTPQPRMNDVAVGDLDADGLTDAIVAYGESDAVRAYFADGSGRLVPGPEIATIDRPTSVSTADFDGDGALDVAVVSSDGVVILRNDGAGGLSESNRVLEPGLGGLVSTEDWNGDSAPDLLTRLAVDALRFSAGDGSGGFTPPRTVAGDIGGWAYASGDCDGDGNRDLLVETNFEFHVLRGDGRGGFRCPSVFGPPSSLSLVLADSNGDGHLDAWHGIETPPGVALRLGAGNGTFGPPLEFPLAFVPADLAAGDVDGDGAVDLVAVGSGPNSVGIGTVLFGDPTSGEEIRQDFPLGPRPRQLLADDFDADGSLDLVVLHRAATTGDASSVTFIAGDNGGGGSPTRHTSSVGNGATRIARADFDSNGVLDLAVGKSLEPTLLVLRGTGYGRFVSARAIGSFGYSTSAVETGDFDQDGHADIAERFDDGTLSVLFGDGEFTFGFQETAVATRKTPASLRAADWNGDGNLDLATLGGDVFLGDGARGFELHAFRFGADRQVGTVGDVTGDGMPDIVRPALAVVVNATRDPVRTRRGNVNAAAGAITDVVLVNGSRGEGPRRRITVAAGTPVELRVEKPPAVSGPRARLVVYEWLARGEAGTVEKLPFGLGWSILPMPLVPGGTPAPRRIWNSIRRFDETGAPTDPSSPAPTVLFSAPNGFPVPATITYQGLIVDPAAPNGRAAVTNAVELVVR